MIMNRDSTEGRSKVKTGARTFDRWLTVGAMASTGSVRFWDPEEGWGVIDSPETPSGCWAHFTHIQDDADADADTAARGFRELSNGQPVGFTWEKYPQDGYEFRVIAVWPATDASP